MQWGIRFERGTHAWQKGEWCSSSWPSDRHRLGAVFNYSNCEFNKWNSNMVQIQAALPMTAGLKAPGSEL